GDAKADRSARQRADDVGERVAEGEHELAALEQDQRLDGERREGREAAEQSGDEQEPQQLVGRVLEPEEDGADREPADAIDEERAERKSRPARVEPESGAPA